MTIEQKAQKFLLDNDCGDLILNDTVHVKRKDWIYASDIMTKFYEFMCESQKKDVCEHGYSSSRNCNARCGLTACPYGL